jgi:hypothetical protein
MPAMIFTVHEIGASSAGKVGATEKQTAGVMLSQRHPAVRWMIA